MKTNWLAVITLGLALAVSCDQPSAEEPEKEPATVEAAKYLGTVSVLYQDENYDNENITVDFVPDPSGTSVSITLYQIRFVPQMPVTVDVTVPSIPMSAAEDGSVTFACDNVIPLALGGEYPRYTVTGMSGELKDETLSFSLNYGDFPTSFSGSVLK